MREQYATLEISKISYYSNLHNLKFTHEGLRVWKAFNVGPEKLIPWNDIVICPQTKTNLLDEIPFFPTTARRFALKEQSKAHVNDKKLYECPETSCTEEFQSQADLNLHMNLFNHRTTLENLTHLQTLWNVCRLWIYRLGTKNQNVCKFILQTFCLVFSSVHFKMSVKCL